MPQVSKREPILAGGLALIHRRGFASTGVAALAAAGGAPKGSFYNHFASKDAFALAALDRYLGEIRIALRRTLGRPGRSPLAGVRDYFELLRELGERDGFAAGCLIGNLSAEAAPVSEELREHLALALDAWERELAASLAAAAETGEVRGDVPAPLLARLLLDAWQGALLRAKVERSAAALDAFLQVALPSLLGASAR